MGVMEPAFELCAYGAVRQSALSVGDLQQRLLDLQVPEGFALSAPLISTSVAGSQLWQFSFLIVPISEQVTEIDAEPVFHQLEALPGLEFCDGEASY